jgi:hypothetical protein
LLKKPCGGCQPRSARCCWCAVMECLWKKLPLHVARPHQVPRQWYVPQERNW